MKKKEKNSKGYKDITEMFKIATVANAKKGNTAQKKKENPKENPTKKKVIEVEEKEVKNKAPPKKTHSNEHKHSNENTSESKKKKVIDNEAEPITEEKKKEKKGEKKKSTKMDIDEEPPKVSDNTPIKKPQKKPARKTTTNKKQKSENEIIGPLSDYTIVLTGEFPISRDNMKALLQSFGARVTGSVSSRTSLLVHGDRLEDGRHFSEGNKYKEAMKKGVKIASFSELEDLLKNIFNDQSFSLLNTNPNETEEKISLGKTDVKKKPAEHDEKSSKKSKEKKEENSCELWSERYKPQQLEDIIGNTKTISNFIAWLDDWDDVVLRGNKKPVTKGNFRRGGKPGFDNVNARACLITGDPGIGKTSSVRLIAKLKGYKTYETNASEQRNKASINLKAGFLYDNTTLCVDEKDIQKKNLIIMDEVDGMAGNEDRGGVAALIDIIKKTKVPIICIANDRQNQKLKSLANYCYDLRFSKPDKRQISQRLMKICEKEGIKCEMNALEFLCESVGNDIRQCINFVEMWSKTHDEIKFSQMNKDYGKFNKDSVCMISNFDAGTQLLNSVNAKKMSFRQRLDLYFIDYDLIPLLIQENYLNVLHYDNKKEELENMASASDMISYSDIIDRRIMAGQNWSLLSDKGIIGSVSIGSFLRGGLGFPKFPDYLGKMSTIRKIRREIKELRSCFPMVPRNAIKKEIAPFILTKIVGEMDKGNIEAILAFMRRYKITMELLKENIFDLAGDKIRGEFDHLGTSVKANLTREYNKHFKSSITRKKEKNKTTVGVAAAKFDEEGNMIVEEEKVQEEEDQEESSVSDSLSVKQGKGKTKAKSKVGKDNKGAETKKPKKSKNK